GLHGTRPARSPGVASGSIEKAPLGVSAFWGFFRSRPVSRILSRVTIPLGSYPGPRRAASTGPVRLAPDGVWLAAASPRRWWALTPPFHPYRWRLRRSVRGGETVG